MDLKQSTREKNRASCNVSFELSSRSSKSMCYVTNLRMSSIMAAIQTKYTMVIPELFGGEISKCKRQVKFLVLLMLL